MFPQLQISRMNNNRIILISAVSLLVSCAFEEVKPWQRDLLAEDKMQIIEFPIEAALDEHIYFSKEASSGGQGLGGGGCGCN